MIYSETKDYQLHIDEKFLNDDNSYNYNKRIKKKNNIEKLNIKGNYIFLHLRNI